ncbi:MULTISPECIES: DUF1707 SHOCT-like domain-containing protein [Nocardiopsis]|uniref:DUF1707 domain-containing protein n=2 Tax=Nocardiopsis alba TaxID=53437 RepID=A0A7K2IVE0_9ACTN|nr:MULTISPECIES: DUF1707 domain-containing protein [Nocardiopsis]AFR05780.1 hypothetical protein B005_3217 [Nocardiopsis alba ATCC BAA-2165]MEC3894928.1 DUF1707 domain-containing protein [Nocardiopsis sp. LDBS1602]MYR33948.1 DUF1707 domain-containing protein [Nocardiopsis alba]
MMKPMSEITPSDDPNHLIRASDADRDAVAHRLREGLAEGRLDPDEHGERLDAVYRAKTLGELVPLTKDLPDTTSASGSAPVPADFRSPRPVYGAGRVVNGSSTSSLAVAFVGGADRSGDWVLPKNFYTSAVMGGVDIDLREARFTHRETTIWICATMGGVGIIVPDDIQIRVHGLPIMGGFGIEEGAPPSVVDPEAPIVHIRGLALMGGVGIKYRPRRYQGEK